MITKNIPIFARTVGSALLALTLLAAASPAGAAQPPTASLTHDELLALAAETVPATTPAWSACDGAFQCATVSVPVDYDSPRGGQLSLALVKLPATDPAKRIGTLFVNFGGPGASGVDRLKLRSGWDYLFSPELKERFDLVSWDTRGVYHSTAVRCFETGAEQQAFFASQPYFPVGAEEEKAYNANAAELGRRCAEYNGDLINHLSTANTARDLNVLRRAVGDKKLSFLGLSYGTVVGATYANLFPGKVRALVLDGSLDFIGNATGHGDDGARLPLDTRQDVPRGMAETFTQFLTRCDAAGEKCAFSGGARAKFDALMAVARQHPIDLAGQRWTYASIAGLVSDNLVTSDWWADLAVVLQQLHGAATGAPVARTVAVRAAREEYNNRSEAFYATNCVDSDVPRSAEIYSALAVSEEQRVPYFGPIGVFDYQPCAFWPGRDTDRYTGPWNRWTAAPLLVVNNRYDPSTPLHGAADGAAELARGHLFVIEGAGHTGMYVPSACGERVKREYLFSGVLPGPGVTCAADNDPFA